VRFVGNAVTEERLHMSVGGPFKIPYLQRPKDSTKCLNVCGEIYLVDNEMLEILDKIEGVPHHYTRESAKVTTDGGGILQCNLYVKTKVSPELLELEPVKIYTLEMHFNYIPPPLRNLEDYLAFTEKIRTNYVSGDNRAVSQQGLGGEFFESETWKSFVGLASQSGNPTATFLEIACGDRAEIAEKVCRSTPNVACTISDMVPEQIAHAKLRLPNVKSLEIDVNRLSSVLPFRSVDLVACIDIFDDIPANLCFHALRCMASVAKRALLVSVPDGLLEDLQLQVHSKFGRVHLILI